MTDPATPAVDNPALLPPRIAWAEPAQSWVALSMLNSGLRLLTLGLYHFWGKTEIRQRIWQAVRIDGEPLEYRGTGGELFRSFLIVFLVILLPVSILGFVVPFLVNGHEAVMGGYNLLVWTFLLMLSGVAMHRARRYRLSRTAFRGIRGGLSGASMPFAWTYIWTLLLVPLTFGWIYPYRALVLHRALTQASRFGDAPFTFTGKASALYRRFWVVWVAGASLVALSIAAVAGVAGTTFRLAATVPSYLWLTASNFLMRLFTLGVLSPLAEARTVRYIVERLSIEGPIPWSHIGQNPDALLKRGEGLAEALNVDAF